MTIYRQSAYNGTEFTDVSASAESFTSKFISNGLIVYRDDGVFGGSARFTGQAAMQHTRAFASGTLYWRGYFKIDAAPTSNRMFISWATTGNASLASLGVDTNSKWRLRNSSGTTTATSVTAFTPGTWYGILYQFNPTTGAQSARFYLSDGTFFEEIVGTGTIGSVGMQSEGVLQGDSTVNISFDGTATANEVLTLTGGQVDPPDPEAGDPYRTSPYEGIPGAPLGVEDGNGYYSAFDGVGQYVADGFDGSATAARYSGQYGLQTTTTFGQVLNWSGWLRFPGYPDANRIISVFWSSSLQIQAAVGIDTAGKWRLRALDGATVATSVRRLTPGQWYGFSWTVNRTTATQTLTIYSYYGSVLEVLTGGIGTGAYDQHVEGGTQGRPTWYVDLDKTVLHRKAVEPSTSLTEIPSNLQFQQGRMPSEPVLQPMYWNGVTLVPLTLFESL